MADDQQASTTGKPTLADAVEFAENPEPRCPCVLLLDVSGSMEGEPIAALNEGLRRFKEDILKDRLASKRVEVAVVTYSDVVQVAHDFTTPASFEPPTLVAGGLTHVAGGIHHALDLVQARKAEYKASGIAYYRPWVFMITDGEPQGETEEAVQQAAARLRDEEAAKRVAFFAVGVEGANMERLAQVVVRAPVKLKGLDFVELFLWLSASMQRVSQSKTDEQVALPPTGWAQV